MKKTMFLMLGAFFCVLAFAEYDQTKLERRLWFLGHPRDNYVSCPLPEYVAQRDRDAIRKFKPFITQGGWTTNQLINQLFIAYTGNVQHAASNYNKRIISLMALNSLSEIDHPLALNYLTSTFTNETLVGTEISCWALSGAFRFSNFEHEVIDYMKRVCVQTKLYDRMASVIAGNMLECATNVPLQYRVEAITNVAKYIQFSIHHTEDNPFAQDFVLAELIPQYSNSVQRIDTLNYIKTSTTNDYLRQCVQGELNRLNAIPTNELNDVRWIVEDD